MNKWNFKQLWTHTQRLFSRSPLVGLVANRCVLCGFTTNSYHELLCDVCRLDLDIIELGCDFALHNPKIWSEIQHAHLSGLAVVGYYQWPLSQFIPSLKFHGGTIHAKWFGQLLQEQVQHQVWPQFDLVIPLPLHPLRKAFRGYNQAYLIALNMERLNSKIALNALYRKKRTKPQSQLTKRERKSNVDGAFSCDKTLVKDKKILLIDDVVTTGNSLQQAAKALRESGATAVYGAAVALRKVD